MGIEEYIKTITKQMKALGIYKKEFSLTIEMAAKMMVDYDIAVTKFEKSGGNIIVSHTNKANQTNAVKNPFYLAIESLRIDILSYMKELGLTPSALKKINEKGLGNKKNTSPLAKALKQLEKI